MHAGGAARPTGSLGLKLIRNGVVVEDVPPQPEATPWPQAINAREILTHGVPQVGLPEEVNRYRRRNLPNLWRGARRLAAAKAFGVPTFYGALYATLFRGDERIEVGLISLRVVTDAGVGAIVDAFQNLVELEIFKYHAFGTGGTAEAANQTALVTELTTQYATDNVRPTGTQTENGANVYRSVATLSPDSGGTIAVTEHALMGQAATGGGTMLDRSLFAAMNLTAGTDSLQVTYDFTCTSGG